MPRSGPDRPATVGMGSTGAGMARGEHSALGFDKKAAEAALAKASREASTCREGGDGPRGKASLKVTFAPEGKVKEVSVLAPFAGTPPGACIIGVFRRVTIDPYLGNDETLSASVNVR